ncbi:MAG: hypothetical protein ABW190_01560 [Rhizobacter sp.]
MQDLIVGLIVAACAVYAVWVLMPSSLRRSLAQRIQHWPLPSFLGRSVRRAALAPTGCGCDAGCDVAKKPASATQPIQIHRRPR